MNEIVKWYIEQAIDDIYVDFFLRPIVDTVLESPSKHHKILLRALELAVKDVG